MLHAEISVNMDYKNNENMNLLFGLHYDYLIMSTLLAKLIQALASFSVTEKQVTAPSVTAPSSDCNQKYIQNHSYER